MIITVPFFIPRQTLFFFHLFFGFDTPCDSDGVSSQSAVYLKRLRLRDRFETDENAVQWRQSNIAMFGIGTDRRHRSLRNSTDRKEHNSEQMNPFELHRNHGNTGSPQIVFPSCADRRARAPHRNGCSGYGCLHRPGCCRKKEFTGPLRPSSWRSRTPRPRRGSGP